MNQAFRKFFASEDRTDQHGLVVKGPEAKVQGNHSLFRLLCRADSNYDEATKCYKNALRIDKENLQILRDLAQLQVKTSQPISPDHASLVSHQGFPIAFTPQSWDRNYLPRLSCRTCMYRDGGRVQVQIRDYAGYIETRQTLLHLKSSNRQNWISLALAHHLNKEYDTAIRVCALASFPHLINVFKLVHSNTHRSSGLFTLPNIPAWVTLN